MSTILYIFIFLFLLLFGYVLYSFYKMRVNKKILNTSCLVELFSFITNHGGHFLSHLMFLNDKFGYYAVNRSVYFSFQKMAGRIVVLGDPIGERSLYQEAIKELQDKCKASLIKQPIFYQISSNYKEMYEKLQYRVIKIGEEAQVYLPDFNLEGKKRGKLRTSRNKLEREGYSVQIVMPPHSNQVMNQVKSVSDVWLGNRSEKGFSVSFFDYQYISRFPIALVVNKEQDVVAFATLPGNLSHDGKSTIHVDLMRYIPTSPPGTMDYLFTSILLWGKNMGYDYCSLGMAPLSNVCTGEKPRTVYEWTASMIYNHGESIYKFKGLRDFKSKFATHWEPRYIAYKRTTLIGVLFRLVLLIHNKKPERKANLAYHLIRRVS
ncbi:phosphatidylglycerol lysyltransferase domain-containing protein [Bacillus pinisoli]|uniref:phosphatidylglycerol lysyltransferase domain-containing protein n=1 Tax=Bacillus pinisoli TaxID=2901866 RepID=UPI001FF2226A|nr:phosphatidylglycerol lysyltransferase domain-containing protein [Bacillus pinisoli]